MDESEFTEVTVECTDCATGFPIMVHDSHGETITICESCMTHLEVVVEGGEVADVTPT